MNACRACDGLGWFTVRVDEETTEREPCACRMHPPKPRNVPEIRYDLEESTFGPVRPARYVGLSLDESYGLAHALCDLMDLSYVWALRAGSYPSARLFRKGA